MKSKVSKFGVLFTILFNVVMVVFIIFSVLFMRSQLPKVISVDDFTSYMKSKGCVLTDLQAEKKYDGVDSFLVSNVESCPYLVSYTIFNDDYVRDDYFKQTRDDVLNNNQNVKLTERSQINVFSKFYEYLTSGDYYKVVTLNGDSVLYISGNDTQKDEIDELLDNFGYRYVPHENLILIICSFAILSYIFYAVCLWGTFKKTGRNKNAALIPIYNTVCLAKDVLGSGWYAILFYIVPFVNVIFSFVLFYKLGKRFGKNTGYSILLMLLPMIFWPLLAFDNSRYSKYEKTKVNIQKKSSSKVIKEDSKGVRVFKWILTGFLLFISLIFILVYIDDTKLISYLASGGMFFIYALLACPTITSYTRRFKTYTNFKSFIIMILAFINLILVCALPY